MLREAVRLQTDLGKKSQSYMNSGQLVPDGLILELVERRLEADDCRGGYLLDGFPRTLDQARRLDESLKRLRTPLSAVVELRVDSEELVKRLSSRGRSDDQPEVVRKRLEAYHAQTAPLSQYYAAQGLLRAVDGQGTPEEVFQRIRQALN